MYEWFLGSACFGSLLKFQVIKNLEKIFQEKIWTPEVVFTSTQLKKSSDEIQARVK